MKLLILCVDGLDPDKVQDYDFNLENSQSLSIPSGCFVETGDGPQPATGRVWPSIFSGRVIDQQLIERTGVRLKLHNWLIRHGARELRDKLREMGFLKKAGYTLGGWNEDMETVFTDRRAFTWNLPTLSPEWVVTFPDFERLLSFTLREYQRFCILSMGLTELKNSFEVGAVYTRILDVMSHLNRYSDEVFYYEDLARGIEKIRMAQESSDDLLMVISDHGIREAIHTDHAYIGANFSFEAESILDIRGVIEEALTS